MRPWVIMSPQQSYSTFCRTSSKCLNSTREMKHSLIRFFNNAGEEKLSPRGAQLFYDLMAADLYMIKI